MKVPHRMTIELSLLNSAFEDNPKHEIIRILRDIADRFERNQVPTVIMDVNGNEVGQVIFWTKGGKYERGHHLQTQR